jgi:hypothetical protein
VSFRNAAFRGGRGSSPEPRPIGGYTCRVITCAALSAHVSCRAAIDLGTVSTTPALSATLEVSAP